MPIRIHPHSALWHGHDATPAQVSLFDQPDQSAKKPTQADLILNLLRLARARGTPLPFPEILKLHVGQYNARLKELRQQGYEIKNEMTRTADGTIHSTYRLVFDPVVDQ
jgi:hypothetical protein